MLNKKRYMIGVVILGLSLVFTWSGCSSHPDESTLADAENHSRTLQVILPDGEEKVFTAESLKGTDNNLGVEVSQLLGLAEEMPVLVFSSQGKVVSGTTKGLLGIVQGEIYYQERNSAEDKTRGVFGLMVNPPPGRITQVAEETKNLLADGKRVLILYLDGFGFLQFEEGKAKGLLSNMGSWKDCKIGVTVYPSITPVAYAAMVTGKNPEETGIKKRGDGPLAALTIFHWAEEMGKKTLVLEGNQHFFDFPGELIFHQDLNGDDLVDDEIFVTAKKTIMTGNYDLVLVHFHSIDDVSHTYGPGAPETWLQVKRVDQYVGELLNIWQGQVIIVADHGQHDVDDDGRLGNHGDFIPQDMFIPMMIGEVK